MTRARLIQIWFAAVVVAIAIGVVLGVGVTMSTGVFLIAAALVPPAILLYMWRPA